MCRNGNSILTFDVSKIYYYYERNLVFPIIQNVYLDLQEKEKIILQDKMDIIKFYFLLLFLFQHFPLLSFFSSFRSFSVLVLKLF